LFGPDSLVVICQKLRFYPAFFWGIMAWHSEYWSTGAKHEHFRITVHYRKIRMWLKRDVTLPCLVLSEKMFFHRMLETENSYKQERK